jgi:hypothetical protein
MVLLKRKTISFFQNMERLDMKKTLLAATTLLLLNTMDSSSAVAMAMYDSPLYSPGIEETKFDAATTASDPASFYAYDTFSGALDANTKITFSYNVNLLEKGNGSWTVVFDDNHGNSFLGTTEGEANVGQPKDPIFDVLFSLINETDSPMNFRIFLQGNKEADVSSSYHTQAVSNVPLPAALPLFGLGLGGLAVYTRLRKRRV